MSKLSAVGSVAEFFHTTVMIERSLVLKIGSNSLFNDQGTLDEAFCERIIRVLEELRARSYYPLLVLSGSVATGKVDTPALASHQSLAARGQLVLAALVHTLGQRRGLKFGLLLLSREDVVDRSRYDTFRQTLKECCAANIVPLINENDATAAAGEHDFVDNDQLATVVGLAAGAEKMFLFTNVAGVFRIDPSRPGNADAAPIAMIRDVNAELVGLHLGKKSLAGRGGMETKLRAARIASFVGMTTYIIDGRTLEQVLDIIDGRACHGTMCLPWPQPIELNDRMRWLIATHTSSASIMIDDGAAKALRARKSLLAVGIKRLYGTFDAADSVEVIDLQQRPVALGVAEVGSPDLARYLGAAERPFNVEVMHADKLILLPQ